VDQSKHSVDSAGGFHYGTVPRVRHLETCSATTVVNYTLLRRQFVTIPCSLMRVFQHSRVFTQQKSVAYFLRNRTHRNGACGFLRRSASKWKRLLIFPKRRRRTRQISELRLRSTIMSAVLWNVAVAAALRLRYAAL